MRYKILGILAFLFASQTIAAQIDLYIKTNKSINFDTVSVLVDKNYSFSDILSNPDLPFTKKSKMQIKDVNYYWVKCTAVNQLGYDKTFAVWSTPIFNSWLYYFNFESKKWVEVRGGEMVANNTTHFKHMPLVLKANETTTFYIKVDVSEINQNSNYIKPSIGIENNEITTARRTKQYDWWLSTIVIVLAFLVYNLYWYIMIREKVYLYYLIILVGGIIYITSVGFFLSYFISFKKINALLEADSNIIYTPIELMTAHLGVAIVLYGFTQFTRIYLKSKNNFPSFDRLLKFSVYAVVIIQMLFVATEYFKFINPDDDYVFANNLIILTLLILNIILTFKSYVKKTRESKYFVKALCIPTFFLFTLVVCLTVTQNNTGLSFLPNIAIISITITFGVLLVAKVNLIKAELSHEKFEKQAILAQNEIEIERNLRLQAKIEYDKNEVTAAQHIKLLMKELHHRVKNNLQIVSSLLSLQSFRIKDQTAIDAVKEGQHRIEAMSLIHQKLYIQDNITQVNIQEFITDIAESLMEAYGFKKNNFELEINVTEELLDVDKAIPLSIIINELITNAFKYAYQPVDSPELKISFTKQITNACLVISDNGIGIDLSAWKNNDGYGKELVQTFTEQLQGTLTVSVNNGTTFEIVFPF